MTEVGDVMDALRALMREHYDAVVTDDENMPDGSGRFLLFIVQERYPQCRRVLISSETRQRTFPAMYERSFAKPLVASELAAFLRTPMGAETQTAHD